jgi:hypothetical protein
MPAPRPPLSPTEPERSRQRAGSTHLHQGARRRLGGVAAAGTTTGCCSGSAHSPPSTGRSGWCLHHEPSSDGTPAHWVAMQQHARKLIDVNAKNIALVGILNGWEFKRAGATPEVGACLSAPACTSWLRLLQPVVADQRQGVEGGVACALACGDHPVLGLPQPGRRARSAHRPGQPGQGRAVAAGCIRLRVGQRPGGDVLLPLGRQLPRRHLGARRRAAEGLHREPRPPETARL